MRGGLDARGCSASRLRSRHIWGRVTRRDEREGVGAGVGGGVGARVSSLRFPRATDGTLSCVILIDHLDYEAPVESGSLPCPAGNPLVQPTTRRLATRLPVVCNIIGK